MKTKEEKLARLDGWKLDHDTLESGYTLKWPFWHNADDDEVLGRTRPLLDGVVAVSSGTTDSAVSHTADVELFYLIDDDEVWVSRRGYTGNAHSDRLEESIKSGETVERGMLAIYGEPLARTPCPDTPEELLTWARMVAAIHGGDQ